MHEDTVIIKFLCSAKRFQSRLFNNYVFLAIPGCTWGVRLSAFIA